MMKKLKLILVQSLFVSLIMNWDFNANAQVSARCKNIKINLAPTGYVTIAGSDVDDGSSGDPSCSSGGILSYSVSTSVFSCKDIQNPVSVVLTVTDYCSNSGTCNAAVTVHDVTPPTVACRDIDIQLDANGFVKIEPSDVENGVGDACGLALSVSPANFDCTNIGGGNTVILKATDLSNNSSTCSATVTVHDVLEPSAKCMDILIQLNLFGTATIVEMEIDNGSEDACGVTLAANPNSFDCTNLGNGNLVTLTVTDPSYNENTCIAVVTVQDNIPPTAICRDINVLLDANGYVTIAASDIDNGSSDACGVKLAANSTSFSCVNVGMENFVILTAIDPSNNTSNCISKVTVEDVITPTAICKDIVLKLGSNGLAHINAIDLDNGSNDACGIMLSTSHNIFTCSDIGNPVSVNLIVTDPSSNMSDCISYITVQDVTPPKAICQNINVRLNNQGSLTIQASDIDNGSNDVCGVSLSANPNTFDCSNVGISNTVILTATDPNNNSSNCVALVTVENPIPSFSYVYDCGSDSLRFNNNILVKCSKSNTYEWDFGDGNSSVLENPVHKYGSSGTYNVIFTIKIGGLSELTSKTITIYPEAVVDFTATDVCDGDDVKFINQSNNASNYYWDFDDNTNCNLTNPDHLYANSGNYNVKLSTLSANGCHKTVTKFVTVKVKPSVSFLSDDNCLGDATPFINKTQFAHTCHWSFGDNSVSTDIAPIHTYGMDGSYTVRLVASNINGCTDSLEDITNIWSLPEVSFTAKDVCDGIGVNFNNTSSNASSYEWKFGDGVSSTSMNPEHKYANAGTFTVDLKAISPDGCVNNTSNNINIFEAPKAGYTSADVCDGKPMNFSNTSSIRAGTLTNSWDFGDGDKSSEESPIHTFGGPGKYTVVLSTTSINNCTDKISKNVFVYITPTASFGVDDVCKGTAATFNNLTVGINKYYWSFGDGITSTLLRPTHNYASAKTYDVELTAVNNAGCKSSVTKTVTVLDAATVSFSTAGNCLEDAIVMSNSTTGAILYNWDFGDNSNSQMFAPTKYYSVPGTYTVTLSATSLNNCVSFATKQIVVNPNPVAAFTATAICKDATAEFSNNSTIAEGTITSEWLFGDGGTSIITSPTYSYLSAGSYLATLNVRSDLGCKSTISSMVEVYNAPEADFVAEEVCLRSYTMFRNTSKNCNMARWTLGDGATSNLMFLSHVFDAAGNYNATLIVSNEIGCKSEKSKVVTVNAVPIVDFIAPNGCQGTPISFSNLSSGATDYIWYFGSEGTDVNSNPSYVFDNSGFVTVKLRASSVKGCQSEVTKFLEVYESPIASFGISNNCIGAETHFSNYSKDGFISFWDFGDGNNSEISNPSHKYVEAGTFTVNLTVKNARCSDITSRNIFINVLPSSDFTYTKSGREVSFSLNNTQLRGEQNSYIWNFGDASKAFISDPFHQYSTAIDEIFNVCLKVTDNIGCKSETCKDVHVDLMGVKELASNDFRVIVYPNPNKGNFKVTTPSGTQTAQVILENTLGVTVAQASVIDGDNYQFNVESLPTGVYFVKLILDGKITIKRVEIGD